jgi:hypothetical protein
MTDDLIKELRSYPAHYVAAHRASDVLERIDFYNCRLEDDLVKLEAAAESLREYIAQQQLDIISLGQQVGRLREALQHAVEELEFWGAYASDYFKEKHGFDETIEKLSTALAEKEKK